jgi:hypothetical protein
MADRPFFGLEAVALGVVEGFSFGIVSLFLSVRNRPTSTKRTASKPASAES